MDKSYILIEGQGAQQGGEFQKVLPPIFEEEDDALKYLTDYLKYDTLGISLRKNIVPKTNFLPEWVLDDSINLYPISLVHHRFCIGWFIVECPDEETAESIIDRYSNKIIVNDLQHYNTFELKNWRLVPTPKKIVQNEYLSKK